MYFDDDYEKNVTYYLMPPNVTSRFEFFEGFGWKEFKYVAIAIAIGVAMFYLTGLVKRTEQFDRTKVPVEQTIGIEQGKNVKIEGDIVTITKDVIPAPIRMFFIIIPAAGTFIFVKKDKSTGMSLIDLLQRSKSFRKGQKLYLYKLGSGSEG